MALVVFLQEDEYIPSVNRSLNIFCETAPSTLQGTSEIIIIVYNFINVTVAVSMGPFQKESYTVINVK